MAGAAERMRRYRARKRPVRALKDASDKGVAVEHVYESWLIARVVTEQQTHSPTLDDDNLPLELDG